MSLDLKPTIQNALNGAGNFLAGERLVDTSGPEGLAKTALEMIRRYRRASVFDPMLTPTAALLAFGSFHFGKAEIQQAITAQARDFSPEAIGIALRMLDPLPRRGAWASLPPAENKRRAAAAFEEVKGVIKAVSSGTPASTTVGNVLGEIGGALRAKDFNFEYIKALTQFILNFVEAQGGHEAVGGLLEAHLEAKAAEVAGAGGARKIGGSLRRAEDTAVEILYYALRQCKAKGASSVHARNNTRKKLVAEAYDFTVEDLTQLLKNLKIQFRSQRFDDLVTLGPDVAKLGAKKIRDPRAGFQNPEAIEFLSAEINRNISGFLRSADGIRFLELARELAELFKAKPKLRNKVRPIAHFQDKIYKTQTNGGAMSVRRKYEEAFKDPVSPLRIAIALGQIPMMVSLAMEKQGKEPIEFDQALQNTMYKTFFNYAKTRMLPDLMNKRGLPN